MRNTQALQGIIAVAAIICIAAGWFNIFSPEITEILSRKVFYILIGLSFILMAPTLTNKSLVIPMYVAAALCIGGAFIPTDHQFAVVKTIGLLAGFIMSIFNRPRGNANS